MAGDREGSRAGGAGKNIIAVRVIPGSAIGVKC